MSKVHYPRNCNAWNQRRFQAFMKRANKHDLATTETDLKDLTSRIIGA